LELPKGKNAEISIFKQFPSISQLQQLAKKIAETWVVPMPDCNREKQKIKDKYCKSIIGDVHKIMLMKALSPDG